MNGVRPEKIRVVPEGVDPAVYRPLNHRKDGNAQRPFRYLLVGKWEARKGIDILIKAYIRAFDAGEQVELILQCTDNRNLESKIHQLLEEKGLTSTPTIIPGKYLSERALVHLYNYCDVFVLPSRAEGWGLPIIEAMACGKPVIATEYSGYLEYLNQNNGYLLEVEKMIDVADPEYFDLNTDYGQWAEPCINHLVHLLRHVFENREEAAAKGRQAREDIVASWTWDHAAEKAWKEIQCLQ